MVTSAKKSNARKGTGNGWRGLHGRGQTGKASGRGWLLRNGLLDSQEEEGKPVKRPRSSNSQETSAARLG